MSNQKESFLNIHVLISHSPSCLNRDEMNLQKKCYFGGVNRARISSQSLKRAIRTSNYYKENLGKPSDRTRELVLLANKYVKELKEFEPDLVKTVIALIAGKKVTDIDENKNKQAQGSVIPWSVPELRIICQLVEREKNFNKLSLTEKDLGILVKQNSNVIKTALGETIDIALSGRMTTSGLLQPVDGAMSLAHSITTHAIEADIDWFTAVDDLTESTNEGLIAGHLGTQEFSSGVFYRYCALNLKQLETNIGDNREKSLEVAAHLVHMLATITPDGKQHSFAAYSLAGLVMCNFSFFPISAVDAFEKPVIRAKEGGLMQPSISALDNYWDKVYKGYGFRDNKAVFSVWDTSLTARKNSLTELKEWIIAGGN